MAFLPNSFFRNLFRQWKNPKKKSLCWLSLSGTMLSEDLQKGRFNYHFKKNASNRAKASDTCRVKNLAVWHG